MSEQPSDIQALKFVVSMAGVDWVGVQDGIEASESLLLFTSPSTGSKVMSVLFNPRSYHAIDLMGAITEQRMKEERKIAERKISIRASTIYHLAKTASDLAEELNELLKGEKCQTRSSKS